MKSGSAEGLAQSGDYADLLGLTVTDATDARILDAALELFAELGISRVGIDDIARQARVNRATLYRRIGSKDVIARAAILKEVARVLGEIALRLREIDDDRATHHRGLGHHRRCTSWKPNPAEDACGRP